MLMYTHTHTPTCNTHTHTHARTHAHTHTHTHTGLHEACHTGDLETVKELVKCVPEAINEFHYGEENPLMR